MHLHSNLLFSTGIHLFSTILGSEGKIRQKSSFENFEVSPYLKNTIKINYNKYFKNFNSN